MAGVIDLSFSELNSAEDLSALIKEDEEHGADVQICHLQKESIPQHASSTTKAIKLNNNKLSDIKGLSDLVCPFLVPRSTVLWLDLSFNMIARLEQTDFGSPFDQVRTLYLHGNKLSDIASTMKALSDLPLKSLTLNGNPLQGIDGYRKAVLKSLPKLRIFDTCVVSHNDVVSIT